ncbi:hypothetical protein [Chitinophaga solisilvae]|uniref:Uncharacterized protein n=1 Tax=Chitinophaga solisilvae TaxID=1233460 RepID=A0A433WGM3_9BACT|nr:hypothetical protein [Chitinophaga solisilvae]NSL87581.1 hypothetical protein [Chitinophaga solisilvae]
MQIRHSFTGILFSLTMAVLLLTACQKDGGYHEYERRAAQSDASMYDYLKSQKGQYDSMVAIIDRLGLQRVFSNTQLTVFGFTNASVAVALRNLNVLREKQQLPPVSLASLNRENLDTLFCRYVIPGVFGTDSLRQYPDGRLFNAIKYNNEMNLQLFTQSASGFETDGPKYIIYSDTKFSFYINKWVRSNTMAMDTYVRNGVLHILSPDHEFGFNEFITRFNK